MHIAQLCGYIHTLLIYSTLHRIRQNTSIILGVTSQCQSWTYKYKILNHYRVFHLAEQATFLQQQVLQYVVIAIQFTCKCATYTFKWYTHKINIIHHLIVCAWSFLYLQEVYSTRQLIWAILCTFTLQTFYFIEW